MTTRHHHTSLIGTTGYVTLPIPERGLGQVALSVRGGTETFAAAATEPIPKYTKVVVIEDRSSRTVTVTAI